MGSCCRYFSYSVVPRIPCTSYMMCSQNSTLRTFDVSQGSMQRLHIIFPEFKLCYQNSAQRCSQNPTRLTPNVTLPFYPTMYYLSCQTSTHKFTALVPEYSMHNILIRVPDLHAQPIHCRPRILHTLHIVDTSDIHQLNTVPQSNRLFAAVTEFHIQLTCRVPTAFGSLPTQNAKHSLVSVAPLHILFTVAP